MKWAKNCAGGHDFIQAVYLKSPMQRLEQGDVVTVTQFPRLTHERRAVKAQDSEQGLLERREIYSARHKAIKPCRGSVQHLTGSGFGVKFSKHTGSCAGQA